MLADGKAVLGCSGSFYRLCFSRKPKLLSHSGIHIQCGGKHLNTDSHPVLCERGIECNCPKLHAKTDLYRLTHDCTNLEEISPGEHNRATRLRRNRCHS